MLMPSNANAIQCQIYQVKYKESKQQEMKLGKITAKGKSGSGAKKGQKQFLEIPLVSPSI